MNDNDYDRIARQEAIADAMYNLLTNPDYPHNRLKKPVKDICRHCGTGYTRIHSILVPAALYCSTDCHKAAIAEMEAQAEAFRLEAEERLIKAIFGEE